MKILAFVLLLCIMIAIADTWRELGRLDTELAGILTLLWMGIGFIAGLCFREAA